LLDLLARLEETATSTWLRESGFAFFSSLSIHSLAMAAVVGINIAFALRLIGLAPAFSLLRFQPFVRLHNIGLGFIIASGLALLLAYPAKALTNPVFYLKLVALVSALCLFYKRYRLALADETGRKVARTSAVILLVLWVVVIFAGRFLAYTNSILLASSFY